MLVIPTSAFQDATTVTSVTIPSSVTSIGANAFQGMTGLTSVTIPPSVNSIGSNVFLNSGIKTVIIQSGMLIIPTSAFQDATTVTSVTIPSSVTSIGEYAFQGMTGLTSITIPSAVSSIGSNAFQGSGIAIAIFEASTLLDGLSIMFGHNKTLYGKSSMSIYLSYKVFNGTGQLTSTIVTDNNLSYVRNLTITGFSSIGASAFQDATSVTSITIPSSVTSIGASAFQGMTGLTSITIPSSVKSIGDSAFQGMTGLTSITIPSSVTSIGASAFQDMTGLTSITIPSSVTSIPNSAFQGAIGLTSISIPSSVTSIGASAFQGMTGLTSITIPSSVTSIGVSAFYGSGITSVTFETTTLLNNLNITAGPNKPLYGKSGINVYLLSNVFNGNGELTSTIANDNGLYYTRNLTITGFSSIGANAFLNATGLTSITIPSSVTSIGSDAFLGSGITTAIFTESTFLDNLSPSVIPGTGITLYGKSGITLSWITKIYSGSGGLNGTMTNYGATLYGATKVKIVGYSSIGSSTFWYNNSLTSVTITASIIDIGGAAFGACPLTEIIVDPANNNYTSINNVLFNKNQTILHTYPIGSTATTYTIPSTVTSTGSSSFFNARNLKSITIPSSVTRIGIQSFSGVSGLTAITIPSSVINIEYGAFQDMTLLTSITIPSSVTSIGENAFQYSGITTAIFAESTLLQGLNVIPGTGKTLYGKSGITVSWITRVYSGSGGLDGNMTNYGGYLYGATKVKIVGYSSIGSSTFWYITTLTSVTIPSSVTSIDGVAFGGCPLTEIIIDPANNNYTSINNFVFNKDQTRLVLYPTGSTATTYTIPAAVTSIGNGALYFARNIQSINLNNITSIEGSSFEGSALTSITISASVTSIGSRAFYQLATPQAYIVDANNNYYSSDSFGALFNKSKTIFMNYPSGNTSTTSYTIPSTVTSMSDDSNFFGANTLRSIIVPSSVTRLEFFQFAYCSNLTNVTLPASIAYINNYIYYNSPNVKSITIPASVTFINTYGFGQSGITTAIFEESTLLDNLSPSVIPGTGKTLYNKSGITVSWITKVFNGTGALPSVTGLLYGATSARIATYTSIGASAFLNATGLRSITIPSSVTTIGPSAFQGSGLTSVTIPSSVTSIGVSAFQNMPNLSEITVNPSNNNYSSDSNGVLFNKNITTLVQYPKGNPRTLYNIPVSVTEIGNNALAIVTNLTSMIIPSAVKNIGSNAFQGMTGITSVTIPASVTSIGTDAFISSGIIIAIFEEPTLLIGLGITTGPNKTLYGKSGVNVSLSSKVFNGSGELTGATALLYGAATVIIATHSSIGASAFQDASGVTSITIPSSVTSIGASAFQGMTGLTSITIPSSVTSIGASAFQGMTGLTSINIPSSVTIIGESAFANSGIKSITIEIGMLMIPTSAFQGMSGLTSITIPSSVTSIGSSAFYGASALTSITIPSAVISIGASAFYGASALTSVTIPSGVTSIEGATFQGATNLTSITIPSNVTSIGGGAFSGASKLTSLIFEAGSKLTSIGNYAFIGTSALTSVTIPSSVTSIGVFAFTSSGLASITIPASVTSIGASAFQGATSLVNVTFPLGVGESSVLTSIGAQSFENTALTTAIFESASTVNTLGLLNGDLINGYTVSSFYGKASVTFIYTEAIRGAISTAAAAIISNSTFTSLLTEMDVNISDITSEIVPLINDPYIEYSAKLTIPDGDLSTLTELNKINIIDTVKYLYATQLGVNVNKIIVTLSSGSIIANVNVLKDGITEASIPICFPKGTPVTTNQGVIAIEKLNPDIHTIRGKKIVAITQTRPLHKYIISIEKDAFGKNVPSAPIQISKEHKVYYKGKMVKAKDLVEVCEGVTRIPYSGETLYNVLMEQHDKMMINNVICETLDPKNIMAKICGGKYNRLEQDKICKELNDIIKTDNVPAYKKLYASLK